MLQRNMLCKSLRPFPIVVYCDKIDFHVVLSHWCFLVLNLVSCLLGSIYAFHILCFYIKSFFLLHKKFLVFFDSFPQHIVIYRRPNAHYSYATAIIFIMKGREVQLCSILMIFMMFAGSKSSARWTPQKTEQRVRVSASFKESLIR